MVKKLDLGGTASKKPDVISREDVLEVPDLDVLLGFAKPSITAAGISCVDDRIELYHSLDGEVHLLYVESDTCSKPSEGIRALFNSLGIERGHASDGQDLDGKIVDLTSPPMAVNLGEAYPDLQVKTGQTIFDFDEVIAFVVGLYPGDTWGA